jgi:hypothetical protein
MPCTAVSIVPDVGGDTGSSASRVLGSAVAGPSLQAEKEGSRPGTAASPGTRVRLGVLDGPPALAARRSPLSLSLLVRPGDQARGYDPHHGGIRATLREGVVSLFTTDTGTASVLVVGDVTDRGRGRNRRSCQSRDEAVHLGRGRGRCSCSLGGGLRREPSELAGVLGAARRSLNVNHGSGHPADRAAHERPTC